MWYNTGHATNLVLRRLAGLQLVCSTDYQVSERTCQTPDLVFPGGGPVSRQQDEGYRKALPVPGRGVCSGWREAVDPPAFPVSVLICLGKMQVERRQGSDLFQSCMCWGSYLKSAQIRWEFISWVNPCQEGAPVLYTGSGCMGCRGAGANLAPVAVREHCSTQHGITSPSPQ